jgi:hypothetical protein
MPAALIGLMAGVLTELALPNDLKSKSSISTLQRVIFFFDAVILSLEELHSIPSEASMTGGYVCPITWNRKR